MEISVIVPALNEEKYIEKCLKSIADQTFPRKKYEIIVSDGASTDGTAKISKKYADRVVVSKKRGIWWGRNFGAKFAKGKYLVFIDSDTVVDRDYLETVYPYLEKGCVGLSSGYRMDSKKTGIILLSHLDNFRMLMSSIILKSAITGTNLCMPKKAFLETGGFRDFALEDYRMACDLKKTGNLKYIARRKVKISPRRAESQGVIGQLKYYFSLCFRDRFGKSKRLKYNEYVPVR